MVYFNEMTHLLVQEKLDLVDYEERLLVRLIKLKMDNFASREMADERKADCETMLLDNAHRLWKNFFINMIMEATFVGLMLIVAMWVQEEQPNFYPLMRSQNQTDCLFE